MDACWEPRPLRLALSVSCYSSCFVPTLMERVQWERLIMQREVPQGSFNLEVLKVRSQPQWFPQGKFKEAWSDKKEFQFVRCILSDKCFPCYLYLLGPFFCSAGHSRVSTPTRGIIFVSDLDLFCCCRTCWLLQVQTAYIIKNKAAVNTLEPLMKHKENSCPYREISLLKKPFSRNTEEC